MKKYIIVLLLCIFASQLSFGQDADDLFRIFSKEKNATGINLNGFMVTCIKPFVKDIIGIKSVKILDLDNCSPSVKDNFAMNITNLETYGYETVVKSNENSEVTRIMLKISNDAIKELLVVTTGNSTCMVRIKGNLKKSQIGKWASCNLK